jgi:hypothetical protein
MLPRGYRAFGKKPVCPFRQGPSGSTAVNRLERSRPDPPSVVTCTPPRCLTRAQDWLSPCACPWVDSPI